jgi:hypothetical protein
MSKNANLRLAFYTRLGHALGIFIRIFFALLLRSISQTFSSLLQSPQRSRTKNLAAKIPTSWPSLVYEKIIRI